MKAALALKSQEVQNSSSSKHFLQDKHCQHWLFIGIDQMLQGKLRKSTKNSCDNLVRLFVCIKIVLMSHSSLNFMMEILRV